MSLFPKLLLASKSPRRHQLLREAGFDFTFVNIDADETYPENLERAEVCTYLASHKAAHFTSAYHSQVLVTADTIVVLNNEVINKPVDAEDAKKMLQKLSGKTHEVYTGVCLKTENKQHVFYDKTEVTFYPLTSEEIEYYVTNYSPLDKAGAYGVQDWMGYIGVEKINGCFYNVMGFPIAKFYRELKQFLQ